MRACAVIVCAWMTVVVAASAQSTSRAPAVRPRAAATLPVRRVVLYKNGVGYFEHVGQVRGNDTIAIDFTSAQLDDVLKSLTVLDQGNGRVSGISYNSDAPLSQRAGAPSQPTNVFTMPDLLAGLRGARLEVRGGARVVSGRLLVVERRMEPAGSAMTVHDWVTLVADGGDIRNVEVTPASTIRLLDDDSRRQVGTYVGGLAATRAPDRRRLQIATSGAGSRDLVVSYISEVPIWKTNYRIVLAADAPPLLQGWAIVDNTTAEDWTDVQLSLLAGAPQSFVERISQPVYGRRPVVEPSRGLQRAPQTHDATLTSAKESGRTGQSAGGIEGAVRIGGMVGGMAGGIAGGLAEAPPPPSSPRSMAASVDVAAAQPVGDLFEYKLARPITIPHNQSALVPIVSARTVVQRVSVWNGRTGLQPLRAIWLTNSSDLTLDGGSFSVIDDDAFAGEGLIEPVKPGETRLLSYAVDLGVQVESRQGDERRIVTRIVVQRGVLTEHREQRTRRVYTIRNNDARDRTVVIEHPRRPGWTLAAGLDPAETSSTSYRFTVAVPSHSTHTFVVEETTPLHTELQVSSLTDDQFRIVLSEAGDSQTLRRALQPLVAAKARLATLSAQIADADAQQHRISEDQQRLRENIRTLRDSGGDRSLAKRYTEQLAESEARIQSLRREQAAFERVRAQAQSDLDVLLDQLALDVLVESRPTGDGL